MRQPTEPMHEVHTMASQVKGGGETSDYQHSHRREAHPTLNLKCMRFGLGRVPSFCRTQSRRHKARRRMNSDRKRHLLSYRMPWDGPRCTSSEHHACAPWTLWATPPALAPACGGLGCGGHLRPLGQSREFWDGPAEGSGPGSSAQAHVRRFKEFLGTGTHGGVPVRKKNN